MAKRATSTRRRRTAKQPSLLSDLEFAQLGGGVLGYIRTMSSQEARERFPKIEEIPNGLKLYALYGADGTPIAITDTRAIAISHATDDDLEIAALH